MGGFMMGENRVSTVASRGSALEADRSLVGFVYARENSQHGGFAGAVVANNAKLITVINDKRNIVESPHCHAFSAIALSPQDAANDPSKQSIAQAWLRSVDRKLSDDVLENDFSHSKRHYSQ